MPSTERWQIVPNSGLRTRIWEGECVVFVPSSTDTHFLDAFSARVFSLLSRPASEDHLVECLATATGVPPDDALLARLRTVLAILSKEGIIETLAT
jgi:PqqD family protein of HPr-rel-A system